MTIIIANTANLHTCFALKIVRLTFIVDLGRGSTGPSSRATVSLFPITFLPELILSLPITFIHEHIFSLYISQRTPTANHLT